MNRIDSRLVLPNTSTRRTEWLGVFQPNAKRDIDRLAWSQQTVRELPHIANRHSCSHSMSRVVGVLQQAAIAQCRKIRNQIRNRRAVGAVSNIALKLNV